MDPSANNGGTASIVAGSSSASSGGSLSLSSGDGQTSGGAVCGSGSSSETVGAPGEGQRDHNGTAHQTAEIAPSAPALTDLIRALETSETSPPKQQARATRKKEADVDDGGGSRKRRAKTGKKSPAMNAARTIDDFNHTIGDALREKRIDGKKAARLRGYLQAGDWSEVAYSLLCEQIPLKRKGKGYLCRICSVPKKGHSCSYCLVCSTAEKKFKRDDHVCVNCSLCYEEGKRKKKLVQIERGGSDCPHLRQARRKSAGVNLSNQNFKSALLFIKQNSKF